MKGTGSSGASGAAEVAILGAGWKRRYRPTEIRVSYLVRMKKCFLVLLLIVTLAKTFAFIASTPVSRISSAKSSFSGIKVMHKPQISSSMKFRKSAASPTMVIY